MDFKLELLLENEVSQFKRDMQEAFQLGTTKEFGQVNQIILPDEDIEASLSKKGAIAYKAIVNNEMVGGAIVVINNNTNNNDLDLLYVKNGIQSKGIGQMMWNEIERKHPNTKKWSTCTPYFEKRNVHFYINCLGFHATEFFNPHHKDPNIPDEMIGGDYFFHFEKNM